MIKDNFAEIPTFIRSVNALKRKINNTKSTKLKNVYVLNKEIKSIFQTQVFQNNVLLSNSKFPKSVFLNNNFLNENFVKLIIATKALEINITKTRREKKNLGRATKVDVSTIAPRNYFFENFYIFNFIISDRKCSD